MCRSEIEGMMAIVVRGDALDPESVGAAFGQVVTRPHVWLLRLGPCGVHSTPLTRVHASHPWGQPTRAGLVSTRWKAAWHPKHTCSDAHRPALLRPQIEEVDAVVSTIGGTPADPSADSEGNINLIKAAIAKGVKRFVLVTSIGTGDSRDAPPQQVYDVLEKVLLEKSKAEDYLKVGSGGVQLRVGCSSTGL
jgi:NAD(P)H-binding